TDTPFPPTTPTNLTPTVPTEVTPQLFPSMAPSQPAPGSSVTQAAALDRKMPVPEYLNPSPNPLTLPTKPSEVTLTGAQPLTLEQAIELAERNNRTIEQAKLQLEQSRAALREAQASNLPTLLLQGDLTRSKSADSELNVRQQRENLERDLASDDLTTRLTAQNQEAALRDNLRDADDARTRITTSLTLSYNLFTAGLRPNQIKAAERLLRISELEVDRVRALTRFNVSNEYYQLQDAEAQIEINAAAVRSSQSNLRDTEAQFQAGLGTKFDVLRVKVQLANNEQQLSTAIANREIQRRRLAQRLSLPESVIVVPADQPEPAGNWPISLEKTIILAYKNRAELEQQLVQREVSEARRKIALSALGPTVSLIAQANFLEAFEDSVSVSSGYSIGAQAQWQLFDGGTAQAQAAQQTKNKELAESRFAEQREAIRFEVEQAYATLISNGKSIETTRQAIVQAEEALRLAVLRFQAGVGTQTERIDAEADLTRSRGNFTSAVIGYNQALAQLRRSVSNLPTDLSQINRITAK
ncbi:TolC family protein, partial [filamentous cyanobacterium LEGE 11480]